uniref:Uncharacterized protein n=1 Tax=Panagrolaimus sp. ES5 TaxID=591445 RepID=A0AC34FZG7_9BILA
MLNQSKVREMQKKEPPKREYSYASDGSVDWTTSTTNSSVSSLSFKNVSITSISQIPDPEPFTYNDENGEFRVEILEVNETIMGVGKNRRKESEALASEKAKQAFRNEDDPLQVAPARRRRRRRQRYVYDKEGDVGFPMRASPTSAHQQPRRSTSLNIDETQCSFSDSLAEVEPNNSIASSASAPTSPTTKNLFKELFQSVAAVTARQVIPLGGKILQQNEKQILKAGKSRN